jgi:hypothetical protein
MPVLRRIKAKRPPIRVTVYSEFGQRRIRLPSRSAKPPHAHPTGSANDVTTASVLPVPDLEASSKYGVGTNNFRSEQYFNSKIHVHVNDGIVDFVRPKKVVFPRTLPYLHIRTEPNSCISIHVFTKF